jgi:hypothetical protein
MITNIFLGRVISDLIVDCEKEPGKEIHGYNVHFDGAEDDFDHVEYEMNGENKRWLFIC